MSQPIISAEREEFYHQAKEKAYKEAGLIKDGEDGEWIGTHEKWVEADKLLEYALNNPEEF